MTRSNLSPEFLERCEQITKAFEKRDGVSKKILGENITKNQLLRCFSCGGIEDNKCMKCFGNGILVRQ